MPDTVSGTGESVRGPAGNVRSIRHAAVALLLVVAACGGPAIQDPGPDSTAQGFVGSLPSDVTDRVVEDAGSHFSDPELQPRVLSIETRTFEAASLGCPQDDETYEQAEIEGFQLIIEATDGQLDYRVDDSGNFILCVEQSSTLEGETVVNRDSGSEEDETLNEEPPDSMGLPDGLLVQIVADAASVASVPVSEVRVSSVEEATFNDSSLGCPKKRESHIQVVTPGWVVVVIAGSMELEFHASRAGAFTLCL